MANFQKLFENTDEPTILYHGKVLHWADKFPVSNGDTLVICIESTNSNRPQGLSIDIEGTCEILGKLLKKGKNVKPLFWEDSEILDPKNIVINVFTKKGYVWVQNIWESSNFQGNKFPDSGVGGAAMIVEMIDGGKRYRCNDGYMDENFDDIIFTIKKMPKST